MQPIRTRPLGRLSMTRKERQNLRVGLLFISPWIVGFLVFTAYPVIYTGYLSFTDYDVINDPSFVGFVNFTELLRDRKIALALQNTFIFAVLSVPAQLVVSLGLDIAKADPTGTWSLTPDGLFEVGRRIGGLKLPTLLVQEGGYNIRSLGRNASRMLTGVCAGALGRRARKRP